MPVAVVSLYRDCPDVSSNRRGASRGAQGSRKEAMSYSVRRALIAGSVALPALLLTACVSGRQTSPEPNGLGSSTGSPAPVPSASKGGPGSAPPGSTTGPAAFPRCHSNDLTPTVMVDSSNGHTARWTLTLTNISDHTCQTRGWVGLELLLINGRTATIDALKVHRIGNAINVVIPPNESTYSILTRPSTDDGDCAQQPTLLVIPPGETQEQGADFSGGYLCNGHIIATALAAGTGTSP